MEKRRKERERGSWASPPARKALFANDNNNNTTNTTTQWGHAFDTPMGKSTNATATRTPGDGEPMRRNWSFGDDDEDDDELGLNANANAKRKNRDGEDDDGDANAAFEGPRGAMLATPSSASAFTRALNDASNSGSGAARSTNAAAFESLYYHRATAGTMCGRSPEDVKDDTGVSTTARPLGSPTPMRLSGSPPAPPKKNPALAAHAAAYGYTPSMARLVVEADEPSTPAFAGPCAMIPSALDAALGIPSVDGATVRTLMTGAEREGLVLIDCRFPYEHGGGRIRGSVNAYLPADVQRLMHARAHAGIHGVYVFYCEFSSERAPKMWQHVRNLDRRDHVADYPALSFPQVYVLRGGFDAFFDEYRECCEGNKVSMSDPQYANSCREYGAMYREAWIAASRAKSMADVDDTPYGRRRFAPEYS